MNLYQYYNKPSELPGFESQMENPAIVIDSLVKWNTLRAAGTAPPKVDITKLSPRVLQGIAESPEMSYLFARHGVKGRWKPGEPALAQSANFAFKYAANVLHKRFPPGEAVIAKDPLSAFDYAEDVIDGPWPPGEAAIASDPWTALWYARDAVRGPFPEGEAAIYSNPETAKEYQDLREWVWHK